MAVLVTGGAGYIGSHVALELIRAGQQPVVLDDLSTGSADALDEHVPFYQGDCSDARLLEHVFARHDIVAAVHLAGRIIVAESVADPLKYYRENFCKSLGFVRSALEAGVQSLVFSSTAAVYGTPRATPVSESAPTEPISPYGASKLMTERMLHDVGAAYPSFRSVSLRYFNVAGADAEGRTGQRQRQPTHLIGSAIDAALGRRELLMIYGDDYATRDGTCERDYIHVTDLAAAHVAALSYLQEGGASAVLNCGYGRGHTVLEVIACLESIIGAKVPVRKGARRPGDPPSVVADVEKIGRTLAWRPRHADLRQILEDALRWARTYG